MIARRKLLTTRRGLLATRPRLLTSRRGLLAAALGLALAACGSDRKTGGPICVGSECTADLYVACFATDEVKGLTRDLAPSGAAVAVDDGPIALDFAEGGLWVSHSLGAPTLLRLAPGAAPARTTLGGGGDLQEVRVKDGLVYTTNSSVSTIAVVDPARRTAIDEVTLAPAAGKAVSPQGFDFSGDLAYVALYGSASTPVFGEGQEIAVVRFANEAACTQQPCGQLVKRISLQDVPGAYDAQAFPFPSRVLRVGTRMFVTISNLKAETSTFGTFYTAAAGSGRLAVIDPAANDALSIVDLGAACTNPGGLAASGSTLWVSCSSGVVVPVDTSPAAPTAGTPVSLPIVPGQIAACHGAVYVTDQFSGKVARFVPGGAPATVVDICPTAPGPFGFAWAADVECGP
jgi:DNA-binding beta-propeller fold protein YncE